MISFLVIFAGVIFGMFLFGLAVGQIAKLYFKHLSASAALKTSEVNAEKTLSAIVRLVVVTELPLSLLFGAFYFIVLFVPALDNRARLISLAIGSTLFTVIEIIKIKRRFGSDIELKNANPRSLVYICFAYLLFMLVATTAFYSGPHGSVGMRSGRWDAGLFVFIPAATGALLLLIAAKLRILRANISPQ